MKLPLGFGYRILPLVLLSLAASCLGRSKPAATGADADLTGAVPDTVAVSPAPAKSFAALRLDSLGLVDIHDIDPRIAVHLVYATPDNFVGEVMYDDLREAYLLAEAARKLSRAQDFLEELKPGYRIIVYDAARPMSVQRKKRLIAEATGKQLYVADPSRGGGLHNYGAAVDVTILDPSGRPLPMGTPYDHLGPEANIDREADLVSRGIISQEDLDNRLLLRSVMRQAGFRTVTSEWWHFNHVTRAEAQRLYPLIDF